MDAIAAVIGEQNIQTAFWLVVGGLVLSNSGLIFQAVYSHIKKVNKNSVDLNEAFRRIRALEKKEEKEP